MELVYLWIKQYKNLNNIEVQLNPKYKVKLDKQNFSVEISENKNHFNVFGDNINIIALAGENGCGKSNFIDALRTILDSAQNDRSKYLEFKYIFIFKLKNSKNFYFLASENLIDKLSDNSILKQCKKSLKSVLFRQFSPTKKYDEYDYPTKTETMLKYRVSYLQGCFYYDDFGEVNNFYSLANLYNYDYSVHPLLLFKDEPHLKFGAFRFSVLNELETEARQRLRNLNNSRMPIIKNLVKIILSNNHRSNIIEKELSIRLIELLQVVLNQYRLHYRQEYTRTMFGLAKKIGGHTFCEQIEFLYDVVKSNAQSIRVNKDFQEFMSLARFFLYNCSNDSFDDILYSIYEVGSKYYPIKDYKGNDIFNYMNVIEQDVYVAKFLNSIVNIDFVKNLFDFNGQLPYSFNQLSSGEQRILRFLADIITLFYTKEINFGKKPMVIFLDEVDLSWHPEWQRKLILYLVDIMKNILSDNEKVTFIISTHSPFILSDIPSQNVVLMKRTGKDARNIPNNIIQIENNADFKTFGTNIHTMLANNFFMKSTIGAFAEKTINEVVKNIRSNKNPEFCNNVIELMEDGIYKTLIKNMQLYQFNDIEGSYNEEN